MKLFIVLVSFFVFNTCLENVCVDVNDILAPQWMPGTLLETVAATPNNSNKTNLLDGTINSALGTMIFHRSMMNQYRCRNYIANQIITEMSKKTVQKRMSDNDKPKPNNMLLDEGSTSYENWLQKTATLDDIYRHHHSQINNLAEPLDKSTKYPPDYHGVPDYVFYENHYKPPPPVYKYQTKYVEKNKYKKGDIFEIALTALAFLSFGLFIIHLIMSISAVMNASTTTPSSRIVALNFPPSAMNAEVDELESATNSFIDSSEEFKHRSLNDPLTNANGATPNELAKKILLVLDSALSAKENEGQCFKNYLCKASKHSRFMQGKGKLFMTLWSLGTSWLSDYLSDNIVSKTQSLEAIVLGLGMANCEMIYSKCIKNYN